MEKSKKMQNQVWKDGWHVYSLFKQDYDFVNVARKSMEGWMACIIKNKMTCIAEVWKDGWHEKK